MSDSILVTVVLIILAEALWIASLVHCLGNHRMHGNTRSMYLVILIVLNVFGSLFYFFTRGSEAGRPRTSSYRRDHQTGPYRRHHHHHGHRTGSVPL